MFKHLKMNASKKIIIMAQLSVLAYAAAVSGLSVLFAGSGNLALVFMQKGYIPYIWTAIAFVIIYITCIRLFRFEKSPHDDSESYLKNGKYINSLGGIIGTEIIILTALFSAHFIYYFHKTGILLSLFQVMFFLGILILLSFLTGIYNFYFCKRELYVYSDKIKYTSLTLFSRLSIPVITIVFIILTFSSVFLYRVIFDMTYRDLMRTIESSGNILSDYVTTFYKYVEYQDYAYTLSEEIRNPDVKNGSDEIRNYLNRVYFGKNLNYILEYYVADADGNTVNNNGRKAFIGNSTYFQKMKSDKSAVLSGQMMNSEYKLYTTESLVPIINDGEVIGAFGATLKTDVMSTRISNVFISKSNQTWLIDLNGDILYHPDASYLGKNVWNDFKDEKYRNIGLITSKEMGVLHKFRFEGVNKYFYKTYLPLLSQNIVFVFDQQDITGKMNVISFQILASLLVIAIVLFTVIYMISKSFSSPIKNTIKVLKKLSKGDLTQQNSILTPDEFGDFLKLFSVFQNEISQVISIVLASSHQLSIAAETLAHTSASLSEGAQTQVSALEESSASLEEVSGSIEMIAEHAADQSRLASEAYDFIKSMNEITVNVSEYAGNAVGLSAMMTEQLKTGSELMKNTIVKMDEIDSSTNQISEIITLIQDISDQVNLLALNAAIEAARAGDHGRGFAVVSDEIAKLADQTAESAKNIRSLVEAGLTEVKEGREYVQMTSKAMSEIVENIKKANSNIEQINLASTNQLDSSRKVLQKMEKVKSMADSISLSTNEQKISNNEMMKAVEDINELTQSVANGAENISSSAEEISAQAENLNRQIEFFKV